MNRPGRERDIEVGPATTRSDLAAVRILFTEYVESPGWEEGFAAYLATQRFEAELAELPGAYAPPGGVLILARVDGDAAGCVACKPLAPGICEMKRLFVRPRYRSLGLGRRLVRAVMHAAADAGYRRMRLDTLPSMVLAQDLYRSCGFREIAPYCDNPVPGAHFLECDLDALADTTRGGDLGA